MSNCFIIKSNAFNTPDTLTKADITQLLMKCNNLPKREARHLVNLFFEEIYIALSAGNDVKLAAFGTFKVHQRKPHLGRNISTGELVPIAARRMVNFLPSQKLKEKLSL
jgi:integration host factor subunit alpha